MKRYRGNVYSAVIQDCEEEGRVPEQGSIKAGLASLLAIVVLALSAPAMAAPQPAGDQAAPSYSAMADKLENDASRRALIDELRQLQMAQENAAKPPGVDGQSPQDIAAKAPSGQSPQQVSFARRVASTTAHLAGDMGNQFSVLVAAVGGLLGANQAAAASGPPVDMGAVSKAAINLVLVVIATFVVFFILRALAGPLFRLLDGWAGRGSEKVAMLRTIIGVIVGAVVDGIVVGLAYLGGTLVSTFLIGEPGSMDTRLSLFLNAFLLVELFKVALRMLFASRFDALRLVPVSAGQAQYINRFLAHLAGWIGYGMLVVVPIINFNVSPALGSGIGTIIMLAALIYAVVVILRKRAVLRERLMIKAELSSGPGRILLRLLGRFWHVLALLYAVLVFGVTVINPEAALPYVVQATVKTLIYAGIGMLVSVVLSQLIGKNITFSERVNQRMPRLQARVNLYIPGLLKIIRALLLILVAALSLDAWQVYDLAAWYASAAGVKTVSVVVHILLILAIAAAIWVGLASLVESKLTPREGTSPAAAARAQTLMSLFHTVLAVVVLIFTVMIVLSEIGIDIAPLIAGAGVLGLAVGFGAQKLVQDVITGVFIQLENAMNTDDYVGVGSISGTVERVGIRSVALRDLYGTYHIVPFSSVGAVSNYTREFGNHVGEYRIAYREDIDEAITYLQAAFEDLKAGDHSVNILAPMTVAGVTALADSSVNIRVVIKATPGMQWAVGRAYNRLVKMHFDKAGIEIPFPRTTLYFGADKEGEATPANLRVLADDRNVVATQDGGTGNGR